MNEQFVVQRLSIVLDRPIPNRYFAGVKNRSFSVYGCSALLSLRNNTNHLSLRLVGEQEKLMPVRSASGLKKRVDFRWKLVIANFERQQTSPLLFAVSSKRFCRKFGSRFGWSDGIPSGWVAPVPSE